jgi:hypothetical protein
MNTTAATDWVLLNKSVVRKQDIHRIEINTQFGVIYTVWLTHGPTIRVAEHEPGSSWLFLQCAAAASASESARAVAPVGGDTIGHIEESDE